MTRRIPLPLADELNVLFGIPAATVAVVLTGAFVGALAVLHGGTHRWLMLGVVVAATISANVRLDEVPVYVWAGLLMRFMATPQIYVCPPEGGETGRPARLRGAWPRRAARGVYGQSETRLKQNQWKKR